jgi:hypothetical protein
MSQLALFTDPTEIPPAFKLTACGYPFVWDRAYICGGLRIRVEIIRLGFAKRLGITADYRWEFSLRVWNHRHNTGFDRHGNHIVGFYSRRRPLGKADAIAEAVRWCELIERKGGEAV